VSIETITIPDIPTPVSRVCLGTWAVGGWMWGGTDDEASIATIRRALDLGINFVDTAPVYGFGHAEELVGRALEGRRDDVVIATKAGINWGDDHRPFRDSRPDRIRREVEDSLRRLRTDRIDLYQVHWPDPLVPFEETGAVLEELRAAGTIVAIGVSNFAPDQLERLTSAAPVRTIQPPYNLFERGVETDILPDAARRDMVVLAYGALCRGLLSGRMRAGTTFGGDDLRRHDPKFREPRYAAYLAAVDELQTFARERHDRSVLALAVRWVLDRGRTVALWGARNPGQLDGVDEVFGWTLSSEDMAEIDAILTRTVSDPVGPEFMAPPTRPDAG